ncbi:hypothetical protein WJX75_006727 [Coccomyxa subellipsoidea]|uniref:Uncharacterized protein n=1 Tax=Coccomyxa subellipsoidea TaxID=248742 RepID=A0ABR2Z1C2_9CHLO
MHGYQVIGGVDKEPDAYNAYLGNIIPANDHVTINRAISLTEFNAGVVSQRVVSQRETGRAPKWALHGIAPGPGEIGCMHASPPC